MCFYRGLAGRRWGVIACVLLAMLATAGQVSAVVVEYTTTGVFAGGGASVSVGDSHVTFNGIDEVLDIDPGGYSNASLGSFSTVSIDSDSQSFNDIGFTLTINQWSPTTGESSLAAELSGLLKRRNSSLELVFDTSSVLISPVLYTLLNLGADGKTVSLNYGQTSMDARVSMGDTRGDVALAPLPAAAWGGMGLMGLIGATRLRRRNAVAA